MSFRKSDRKPAAPAKPRAQTDKPNEPEPPAPKAKVAPAKPPPRPDSVAQAKAAMAAYWGGHDMDPDHLVHALKSCTQAERELLALSVPVHSPLTVTGQRCGFVATVLAGLCK